MRAWAGVCGGLGLTAAALWSGNRLPAGTPGWLIPGVIGVGWLGFALAVVTLRRIDSRFATGLVLAGASTLALAAAFGPPRSSDDLYRYVWDGRVQAAGVDPYQYPPAAPELVDLRQPDLWPATSDWCVEPPFVPGCTLINRPTVPTIYPPAAQLLFLTVHSVPVPAGPRLLGVTFALATTGVLLRGLRRRGADPRRAALWAWCPVVALEAVANAHIDVAAAFFTGAALLVLTSRPGEPGSAAAPAPSHRAALAGGALLGLAIAVKLTPAVVLPAVLRRRAGWILLAVSTVVGGLYLPHLLAVGSSTLGYLGGYAQEEGYAGGSRFALIPLRPPVSTVVAALLLAAAAIWAWRTARPERPWDAAAVTTGALLLVTAPAHPWYALLLVVLVALGARAEWLAVAAAGYVVQWAPQLHLGSTTAARLGYGLAAAVVFIGWLRRRGDHRLMVAGVGDSGLPGRARLPRSASQPSARSNRRPE